ncbi:MBL fold metallo-hydrolase [Bdellovibrionota bacterium FG-2]
MTPEPHTPHSTSCGLWASGGLKQFRAGTCLSYCVYDQGAALLVDPHLELVGDYRSFLAERRLKPVRVVETHTHTDHFSSSHWLAREFGIEIAMSHLTQSARATSKLSQGEKLRVGSKVFEVLVTPGHSVDALCLRGEGVLFSGDTLLIGGSGRTTARGADAGVLFKSLQTIVSMGDALVFPAHDSRGYLFSTLGIEKLKNPHLRVNDEKQFCALKLKESALAPYEDAEPKLFFNESREPREDVRTDPGKNVHCMFSELVPEPVGQISAEKFALKLKKADPKHAFIDVREPEEIAQGAIVGLRNVPVSALGFHLEELKLYERVYLSCRSGVRSRSAAQTLSRVGLRDVVNVEGGIKAWVQAGYSIRK